MTRSAFLFIIIVFFRVHDCCAQDTISINLENVRYPAAVHYINMSAEGQDFRMAYMDVQPASPNGRTVMLFHGKNFAGYYWGSVIAALSAKGYRVVVPDQVGFGRSSKPLINYSFHQLARFTRQLLDTLGITKTAVLGHSMGGMLAIRFTLLFPERTEKLLLEDPIGLEDYRTFVPAISTEQQYKTELKTTPESIKAYYRSSYFPEWKPEYDYLVKIGAGVAKSADFPRYALVSARTFTMIYEQPVIYELEHIRVPTVLFIGKADRTIVGKALLSKEEQASHGQYQTLGKSAARRIVGAKLVEFDDVGHIPHVQVPEAFNKALLENL